MSYILVVEDDIALASTLTKGLVKKGYMVEIVYGGLQARGIDWSKFDLVLLDWNLPGVSGIDLIRYKRSQNWPGCCIMLTAKNGATDKIDGLDFGADDYLAKPFDWEELYSRINACLRRRNGFSQTTLNSIEWQKDFHQFKENGFIILLTSTEYNLLTLFFDNPNKIFRKYDLIYKLYSNKEIHPDSNVIERHISSLRHKFKYDPIQTIQGVGYRLRSDSAGKKIKG